MIISHKHKFIFFHLRKSAGTSLFLALCNSIDALNEGLKPKCKPEEHLLIKNKPYQDYGNSCEIDQHSSFEEVKSFFLKKGWNIDEYFKFTFTRNPWARAVSYWAYQFADQNFEDFCMGSDDVQYRYIKKDTNKVLNKYGKYYYESEIGVDFVGRLENLSEDLKLACDKIGIPNPEMHHHNKSDHKHYTEYYNEKTQEIIAKNYELDISKFGYTFTS